MEGVGSEVSQKIRAAIKAKLIELGAYVDDELPDYIMVMVANKRTKSQMDEDLQLFLAANTKIFTTWLHTVLQKLQEVTVANFENKKDSDGKKSLSKKTKLDSNGDGRRKKSADEPKKSKKNKKHKEGKKSKKNKHKSKEKVKLRTDQNEDEEEDKKTLDQTNKVAASHYNDEKSEEKLSKHQNTDKTTLEDLKKRKNLECDKNKLESASSSSSEKSMESKKKNQKDRLKVNDVNDNENLLEGGESTAKNQEDKVIEKENDVKKNQPLEDDFNIEPLKPSEKCYEDELLEKSLEQSVSHENLRPEEKNGVEKTISAPTEELLKKHNKLLNEKLKEEEEKDKGKKDKSESDASESPEEMRKQLLLSRAKKQLENSKLADRMRSTSPDVLVLEETNREISKNFYPGDSKRMASSRLGEITSEASSRKRYSRSCSSSDDRSRLSGKMPVKKRGEDKKWQPRSSNVNERKIISLIKGNALESTENGRENERRQRSDDREKRKNVIRISESLEMEKNMGLKRESDRSKDKEVPARKKHISSRVVTITGPEAPEIPSIVKVKPREFIAKDKQANKTLILKAVADAEKSVATIPVRAEPQPETKKKPALFTKDLRGKRFEKLAVTLSNIRKSPNSRDGLSRRISVDSNKSEKSRGKRNGSPETSDGLRNKSDLLSRKMSKSDDQFIISSKTTGTEKNDKYIRCWLEGVEKAVKDDEMVNPNDMEDLIVQSNFSTDGNDTPVDELPKRESEGKRKRRSDGEEVEKVAKNQKLKASDDDDDDDDDGKGEVEPQIVVTLDGLDSKTIKGILMRNKEALTQPIFSSKGRRETEGKEKTSKMGVQSEKTASAEGKPRIFEKISDRFGRLNKVKSEDFQSDGDDKGSGSSDGGDVRKRPSAEEKKAEMKSKNRELIAQLSEKFGKIDRQFENKKRKHPGEERRLLYDSTRKSEREDKKSDRRSGRQGASSSTPPPPPKLTHSTSSQICKYNLSCKNSDCRYYHTKKCRFDDDCNNPDCKYVHSESSSKKKSHSWYSRS